MKDLKHISEDELIAYQMHESGDEASIRRHLDECAACAESAASIAETLRVFSAAPVPVPDLERNWLKLRGNLTVLAPARRPAWKSVRWMLWPSAGLVTVAVALLLMVTFKSRPAARFPVDQVSKLHKGPLTEQPTGPDDPQIANHLDSAERLLTEVSHASGPLDEATRSQAHDLLLKNAVYVQTAHQHGDLGEASVLENLGRLLTNIEHESSTDRGNWHLRFSWNTDGLLLEIRILRQNDHRV